ncbi:TPA: CBS domain-containing protein [Candidatus Woesearchaeota archaeon]|nr:CBS domain-containing protein [Candidatus Woesearchaeota archaeon]HII68791.1 CBS domain-containing protein [Candidatus Woesearchaeota archaeon]
MKVKDCVLIEPFTCNEDATVVEVAKKLRETTLRHIYVVNKHYYPVGIISVIDINHRVVAAEKNPKLLKARDIMSKPIDIDELDTELEEVYTRMATKQRVMNAVAKDGKMIGILTIHQVMKNIQVRA